MKVLISPNYEDEAYDETPLEKSGNAKPTVGMLQSLVGSLLWICRCSRPDVSFAIFRATTKAHAPTMGDWTAVLKLLRYLKYTSKLKLSLKPKSATKEIKIEAYSVADW